MEHFIEDKQVELVVVLDEKTPGGNDMVEIKFTDGTKEKMPKMRFELIVSETVSEVGSIKRKLDARLGALLFGTLHEYGIKIGEVNSISDAMVALVNNGFKKAEEIVFGCEYGEIPLININKILLDNHGQKQKDTNGTASDGSGTDKQDKE